MYWRVKHFSISLTFKLNKTIKIKELKLRNKLVIQTLIKTASAFLLTLIFINLTEEENYTICSRITHLILYGKYHEIETDEKGIPIIQYRNLRGEKHQNPVYVSVYGLCYYDKSKGINENEYFTKYYKIYLPKNSGKEDYSRFFFNTANWLEKAGEKTYYNNKECLMFKYHYKWPPYNLESGWKSAMAQALAAQIFLRAWKETKDSTYFKNMMKCINCLEIPVDSGGVTIVEGKDQYWYEEYADKNAKKTFVLNGMEHVLIALYEIYEETKSEEVKNLIDKGNNSLVKKLPLYTNYKMNWTYYDLIGTAANYKYHHININLTEKLFSFSNINDYQIFKKWKNYRTFYFEREFLNQYPNTMDILTLAYNFIFINFFLGFLNYIKYKF